MLVHYRGHVISILEDVSITAELTDLASRTPLPTKVTVCPHEGLDVLLERAKDLVDVYLTPSTDPTLP